VNKPVQSLAIDASVGVRKRLIRFLKRNAVINKQNVDR